MKLNRIRYWTIALMFLLSSIAIAPAQTVQTDKADYAPGETVQISGNGFLSGESVRLQIVNLTNPLDNGDEHQPWDVIADGSGSIFASWYVHPDEANTLLLLTATGLTSGLTAQTIFADGDYATVTVGAQTGSLTYGSAQVSTYTVNLTGKTGGNSVTVNLTASGIPAGATYGFSPNGFSTTAASTSSTLYVTNGLNTAVSTNNITITYNGIVSGNGTLIVGKAPLGITANNDSKTYGQTKTYGTGQTNFTATGLKNSQTIGSVTIVASGGTNASAGAGSYSLTPSAATGGTFNPANYAITYTNGTLTVNKATTSVTVSSSLNPSGFKDAVSFTASLPSDATGNIVFLTNNAAFLTNTIAAGLAVSLSTTNLPRGTNAITARYAGDSNYLGSTNNLAVGQIVTNHPPVAANFSVTNSVNAFILNFSAIVTNASDLDGDTLAVAGFSTSTNGITIVTNSVRMRYNNPSPVSDRFNYIVADGFGGTATGAVSVVFYPFPLTGQNATLTPVAGKVKVKNFGIPGYSYGVQRSTNFTTWVTIQTTNAPSNGVFEYEDNFSDLGGAPASAYYRLIYNP